MNRRIYVSFVGIFSLIALEANPARAFRTGEHSAITQAASAQAVQDGALDLQSYGNLVKIWSAGTGLDFWDGGGKPAEELAHYGDQNQLQFIRDGGPFIELLQRASAAYNQFNFSQETPGQEGYYVLLGACAHLIEDQASPPHAANVKHNLSDRFESHSGISSVFSGFQGNVPVDQAYLSSLFTTQDLLPTLTSPESVDDNGDPARYWLFNDEIPDRQESSRYAGQPVDMTNPPYRPPSLWGGYGGSGATDVFDDREQPTLYDQQTTQAVDYVYYFLLNMSQTRPPLSRHLKMDNVALNGTNPANVTFDILENHTPGVTYTAQIVDPSGSVVATPQVDVAATLGQGPDLPFEGTAAFQYDGRNDQGQLLPDGTYRLVIVLNDNGSPANITPVALQQSVTFSVAADHTPIQIVRFSPSGLGDVAAPITVTLNKPLDPETIANGIVVRDQGAVVSGNVVYTNEQETGTDADGDGSATGFVLVFTPTTGFWRGGATLTATVGGISDLAGNGLSGGTYSWSFTTNAPAPNINHSSIQQAREGSPVSVEADITAFAALITEADVYYRAAVNPSGPYTKIPMTASSGITYSATIPAGAIQANQGLEYFLFVRDSNGLVTSLPAIPNSPDTYAGPGIAPVIYSESNNATLIRGVAGEVTSFTINFYVPYPSSSTAHVNLTIAETYHDYGSPPVSFSSRTVTDILPPIVLPGRYSLILNGRNLEPANYYYSLDQIDTAGHSTSLISQGRFRSVHPLDSVQTSVTSSGGQDQVTVLTPSAPLPINSATLFESPDPYLVSGSQAGQPPFILSVNPSAAHQAAVYKTGDNGRELLIGLQGLPPAHVTNGPDVIVSPLPSPQTNNHPITVEATVNEVLVTPASDALQTITLYYQDSNETIFHPVVMSSGTTPTYKAAIPSQAVGAQVNYYVQAVDTVGRQATDPFDQPQTQPYSFTVAADTIAPVIVSVTPFPNQTGVLLSTLVQAVFNKPLDPTTVDAGTVVLQDASGSPAALSALTFNPLTNILTATPESLQSNTTYTVLLKSGLTDLSGNVLPPYQWSFKTEPLYPAAIYALTMSSHSFSQSVSAIDLSATFSRAVSSMTFVFINSESGRIFRVTNSAGTPAASAYPLVYTYSWNGLAGGAPLPDGVYKWRVEAVDRLHKLLGRSDEQPIKWSITAGGTLYYSERYSSTPNHNSFFFPNYDQSVTIHYSYNNGFIFPSGQQSLICDGREYDFGDYWDREFGGSGSEMAGVIGNSQCIIDGALFTGDTKVDFVRRYVDVTGPPYFTTPTSHTGGFILTAGASSSEDFDLNLIPARHDPISTVKKNGVSVRNKADTTDFQMADMHIFAPGPTGFGDNPTVVTSLNVSATNSQTLHLHFQAQDADLLPDPLIYDKTPPQLNIITSTDVVSYALGQRMIVAFDYSDNLPLGVKNLNFSILSSTGALVRTLFQSPFEVNGNQTVSWDATDANGQPVSDGLYQLTAQAADAVGNSTQSVHGVVVENQPPTLSSAALQSVPGVRPLFFGSQDTGLQVTFQLADAFSPNVSVQLFAVNKNTGFQWTTTSTYPVTPVLQNATLLWDGKDGSGNYVPDGPYAMSLRATNWAGNSSTTTLPDIQIDHTPSLVETLYADHLLFTPDDGPTGTGDGINDTVTLTYAVSDDAQTLLTIQNSLGQTFQSITGTYVKGSGPQSFIWDGKSGGQYVPDGSYVVRLLTTDVAGNQALGSVAVIKNEVPAQLVFPPHASTETVVGGIVTVQGIALNPLINQTTGFAKYELWARAQAPVDFNLPENNPASPDPQFWKPVPVPASYQIADLTQNPAYPNSNISLRSILNGTLGSWDTNALTPGSDATLLLVVKDRVGRTSYDAAAVHIDPSADTTQPTLTILSPAGGSPPPSLVLAAGTDRVTITYSLTQLTTRAADISLEIFQMVDAVTYGPVVRQQDLLGQTTGQTLVWDGRNAVGQPVPDGLYRIRLTARDTDHMGQDVKETDILLHVGPLPPIQIQSFNALPAQIVPGGSSSLSYQLSRPAVVIAQALDALGRVVATYSAQASSDTFVFSTITPGIYQWNLQATSLDQPATQSHSSLAIAVAGSLVSSTAQLLGTDPSPMNGAVRGVSNFTWQAFASGSYFPPQSFTATVEADGTELTAAQTVTDSGFSGGQQSNVAVSGGTLSLVLGSENQIQNTSHTQFGSPGIIIGSFSNDVYAQSFFVGNTGTLNRMEFQLYPQANQFTHGPANAWCELRSDNGGVPGNIISTVFLGDLQNGPRGGWYGANFSNTIAAGTRYWADIRTQTNSNDGYIAVYVTDQPAYPFGNIMIHSYDNPPGYDAGWQRGSDDPHYLNAQDLAFHLFITNYVPSGQFISSSVDTGKTPTGSVVFQPFQASYNTPSNTTVQFIMQTSDDGSSWGGDTVLVPGQPITAVGKRYFRTLINLTSFNTTVTPSVQNYSISYQATAPFQVTQVLPADQTFFSSPTFIPSNGDLFQFFPSLATKTIASGPTYSVINTGNANVTASIVGRPGSVQLEAMTLVQQPWTSVADANLMGGLVSQVNVPFNNDANPNHFTPEAPFDFASDRVTPQVISAGYPSANMTADPMVIDQYLFWTSTAATTIDNPYVAVNAQANGWNLSLTYPDGTPNNTLVFHQDLAKASNTNAYPGRPTIAYDLDDDFSIQLATTGAQPRVFVALKGNTSTGADGFQSYALFYQATTDHVLHSIPVQTSTTPVPVGGTLAYWDVTQLHGDYIVQLLNLDAAGLSTASENVTLGTLVTANSTQTTYVNGPYNKSYLDFPPGSLASNAVVTIVPQSLDQTTLVFDPKMPQPIGPVFDLEPKNIQFAQNPNGSLVSPASLVVRFLPEELQGIDISKLTLYHVTESGTLQALDTRIITETNGVVKMTSPVSSFSYFLALSSVSTPVLDPLPPNVSQSSLTVTGRADPAATISLLDNGALLMQTTAQANGLFAISVPLTTGQNQLSAQASLTFTFAGKPLTRWSVQSASQTVVFDPFPPVFNSVHVSSSNFSPFEGEVSTISFTLSKDALVTLTVRTTGTPETIFRTLAGQQAYSVGISSVVWDGRDGAGNLAAASSYTYVFDAVDRAGNAAQEVRLPVVTDPRGPESYVSFATSPYLLNGLPVISGHTPLLLSGLDIAGRTTIFDDLFSTLSASWTYQGLASTVNNQLVLTNSASATLQGPVPHDSRMWVDVQVDSTSPDGAQLSLLSSAAGGVTLQLHSDSRLAVTLTQGLVTRPLASTATSLNPFATHHIEMGILGNQVTATVDGITYLTVADNAVGTLNGTLSLSAAAGVTARFSALHLEARVVGAGVDHLEISVDSGPYQTTAGRWTIGAAGLHNITVRAVDVFGNQGDNRTLPLSVDTIPPQTTLALSPPSPSGLGPWLLLSTGTQLSLSAADDMAGVASILYRVDGSSGTPFQLYTNPFSLPVGTRLLELFSQDQAGNSEIIQRFGIEVATAPPTTQIVFSPPAFVDSGSQSWISETTQIHFAQSDQGPLIRWTQYRIDPASSTPFQTYFQDFTLSGGTHTLEFQSQNLAGFLEPVERFSVSVDTIAPVSTMQIGLPQYRRPADGLLIISTTTALSLSAIDPQGGSGVQTVFYSLDQSPYQRYQQPITLSVHGGHTMAWFSQDNVGHLENRQSVSVVVDAAAPVTTPAFTPDAYLGIPEKVFISTRTQISLEVREPVAANSQTQVMIDGVGPNASFQIYQGTFSLQAGIHQMTAWSQDTVGNQENARDFSLWVDSVPPTSQWVVGSPSFHAADGTWVITPQTPLVVAAVDGGPIAWSSGLKESRLSINGGAFTVMNGTFTLKGLAGATTLSYYSVDHVLNQEDAQRVQLIVSTAAPLAQLLSPSPLAIGIDQVFGQGSLPIVATINSPSIQSARLEAAPGVNAQSGFTLLQQSTLSVTAQTFYVWDTRALSGFYTLRLTVDDFSGLETISTATVYIGDPVVSLTMENSPQSTLKLLQNPGGITVDRRGQMYVANSGTNEILRFDSGGHLTDVWGAARPDGTPNHVSFNHPMGLAVDAFENLYVADQGNHRVVVLEPSGAIVRAFGKVDASGNPIAGNQPGEFSSPVGVSVNAHSFAVVDAGNARLQIFDLTGQPLYQSTLDKGGPLRTAASTFGTPSSVALTDSGLVIVTDMGKDQAYVFDATGQLVATLGGPGSGLGQFQTPGGVSASSLEYLYIADRDNGRLEKIDPFHQPVQAFGTPTLYAPSAIYLDGTGALYVADSQNNRIFRFGPPGGSLQTIELSPASVLTDVGLAFGSVYVFPNPARHGDIPTFHIEAGTVDQVTVHVYNAAGREIFRTTVQQPPTFIDDNQGNGPRLAYQIPWNGSIPSGTYFYVIEAQKTGFGPIHKTGKLAVVR